MPLRTVLLWALCVGASFIALAVYSKTPGPTGSPPIDAESDAGSPSAWRSSAWRIVMAIHPQCSCTGASLVELRRLLTRYDDRLTCELYVYRPSDKSADWSDSAIVRTARRTPGVTIIDDLDGAGARRYGIATSGGVVLYDSNGVPHYHGGVTGSRGHEGANAGSHAVVSVLDGADESPSSRPTYGCSLFSTSGDEA
ncbi:hypothetical protein [Botrimarina colliarenosi]|uniref:hypothetical protein n=1 Tax=Botrimarina colliarenosi TaxID=2528001 RepID=UPI0018D2DD90|nr:hypothetical protein [Botrimarina colliarenosi]